MVVLLWSGVTLSLRRCPQARAASGWVRDARGELLAQAVSVAVDPVLSDAAPSQPVDADAGEADRCVHRRMPEELSLGGGAEQQRPRRPPAGGDDGAGARPG